MRIAIAEDDVLMRQGIGAVLVSGGHQVVWEAANAEAVLPSVARDRPDVVITDVRMPPRHADDGLRAAVAVRARFPEVGILVLSQYMGNDYARALLAGAGRAGASGGSGGTGYLLKESVGRVSRFREAVEAIGRGEIVIDPRVVSRLLARDDPPVKRLTDREREVLAWVASGRTNAQIAHGLHLSAATVERTLSHVFDAFGLAEVDGNRRVLAVLEYLRQRPEP